MISTFGKNESGLVITKPEESMAIWGSLSLSEEGFWFLIIFTS